MMAKKTFAPNVRSSAPRMVYAWRPTAILEGKSAVDAQVVGETLANLTAQHGELQAAFVVEEAAPETSPLHPLFEWDDNAAADKYRLYQARKVINSVVVTRVDNREIAKPVSAFVSMVQEEGRSYVSTILAMSDAEKRDQILRNARADLKAWQSKYAALNEFSELHTVIDRVLETA